MKSRISVGLVTVAGDSCASVKACRTPLANSVTSLFEFDINDRLTRIRHAMDAAGLFEVS